MTALLKPPVRLCCYERHYGPLCPDGKVMCCLCFERFDKESLWTDIDGTVYDICMSCQSAENAGWTTK